MLCCTALISEEELRSAEVVERVPLAADVFAQIKKEAIDPYINHLHAGDAFDANAMRSKYMFFYDLVFQACSTGQQDANPQTLYHHYVDTIDDFVTGSAIPKMVRRFVAFASPPPRPPSSVC